ncbi:MAG: DUF1007 family protein [Pseudomonadota bacterium]
MNGGWRRKGRAAIRTLVLGGALAAGASGAQAHPHVFIDGGVDFVFAEDGRLQALHVTWRFDAFETLYMLSAHGVGTRPDGTLEEADRDRLRNGLDEWPDEFDGSAHLTIDAEPVSLSLPRDLDVDVVDGRLEMRFTRTLASPEPLSGKAVELGFYEATYYYEMALTEEPQIAGPGDCETEVTLFEADQALTVVQTTLFELGREETPTMPNVGALFADRITLECA